MTRFSSFKTAASAIALSQCGLIASVLTPLAVAQEVRVLEEIIVTARRREENIQEVPVAITAFDNEALRQRNIVELSDIRNHVPSLGITVGGSTTNAPIISLRGQRPSEVLVTLDPAVPLYFNDVALAPTQGTNLSMYDLANVQVLKGPQGTLFGRNSTGGAVLFSPKKPGDELGGYVEIQGGDYGLFGFEGAVDIPMGDVAALRISAKTVQRDGYQDNLADNVLGGSEKFWDEDSTAFRATLRLSPADNFENISVVDWNENDIAARVPVPQAFNPSNETGCQICPITNAFFNAGANEGLVEQAIGRQQGRDWQQIETDVDGREKVENLFFSNTTTIEINDTLTLRNIFGYRDMEFAFHNDTDGTALPLFGSQTVGTQTDLTSITPASAPQSTVEADQISNEIQLLGTAGDSLEWILGAYYFSMDGAQSSPTQILPIVPQNSPFGEVENSAWAVFAEGTWSFNDQWALTFGLRHSSDKREVTVSNTRRDVCLVEDPNNLGTTLPDDACFRTEKEDYNEPTWRIVGTWTPSDSKMLYGSVSTGYRTGGFNMRGSNTFELQPFEQETVTSYEIGAKADWHLGGEALLRTNVAIYMQDYEDIQRTQGAVAPDGTFGTTTVNAAEATISGLEFELFFTPIDGLDFGFSYAYIDAGFDEWMVFDPLTDSFNDASNRDFQWTPESSLTTSINWTLPLDASIGSISIGANYYYQSEVTIVADVTEFAITGIDNAPLNDTIGQGGYGVLGMRADWNDVMQSGVDLSLWIKNATDEEYAVGGVNVLNSLGWSANVFGPPRTWGASVRYRF